MVISGKSIDFGTMIKSGLRIDRADGMQNYITIPYISGENGEILYRYFFSQDLEA